MKTIQLLMGSNVKCEECPADKYCKNTNMSCEDTRLQYVCFLQNKAIRHPSLLAELEKEEMLILEANENNSMWCKREERMLEDLYKNENYSNNR
jgi:hypothetical protein